MFVSARLLFVFGLTVTPLASLAAAEDSAPDALMKPWVEAVERFSKARETAKESLVRLLDSAEEKARAAGDLDKVNSIKQERAAFEEHDELPSAVKTATYTKSIDTAKTTLKSVAQKVKVTLVRQKYDADAQAIDQELAELVGPEKPDTEKISPNKISVNPTKPPDSRVYWIEEREKGNEFRWIKSKEWIESTHDGTNKHFTWREIIRTPKYVELHDTDRKRGIRLLAEANETSDDYKPSSGSAFATGVGGKWVTDAKDTVYLSELQEVQFKVWRYNNFAWFGWGKNGQMPKSDNTWDMIYLSNRPTPKGIFTHPAPKDFAMVAYDIGQLRKQTFRARFGICEYRNSDAASKVTFVVLGDGKRLFASEPTNQCGISFDCEVNIRNVNRLELRVDCPGDASLAYAVWYEPRISNK